MKQQKLKIKLVKFVSGGGLNASRSPPHPLSKKALRIASSQHTPDQCILLHDSLTPLVACPKVGTFGCQDH